MLCRHFLVLCFIVAATFSALAADRPRPLDPLPPGQAGQANVPVNLYAKVVDERGRPLDHVEVDLLLDMFRANGGMLPSDFAVVPLHRTSAANGGLTVVDLRGYGSEVVSVRRDGYLLSPWAQWQFAYAGTHPSPDPDPQKPVEFVMWKRRGNVEPKHARMRLLPLPYDGTPVLLDLVAGKVVEPGQAGGDLRVTLHRETFPAPLPWRPGKQFHRWSATLQAVNGGLAMPTADDPFLFEAPQDGYVKSLVFACPDGQVMAQREVSLFVSGRGGKLFGTVWLNFVTDSLGGEAHLSIESHFNLDGSRNLEFDYWQGGGDIPSHLVERYHCRPRHGTEAELVPTTPTTSPSAP